MADLTIDREAMGQLSKALAFIYGADHPTTLALKAASDGGSKQDIAKARKLFLALKSTDRQAAMAMLNN